MSRYAHYDSDEERLPDGMTRIGYDSDTQTYTFRDADGSLWEGPPGQRYGRLHRAGEDGEEDLEANLLAGEHDEKAPAPPSWRRDMMPLLNFGVILGVFLLGLFWFLGTGGAGSGWVGGSDGSRVACVEGSEAYEIQQGDTCWGVAEGRGIDIKDILALNQEIDCEALRVGGRMCVPGEG